MQKSMEVLEREGGGGLSDDFSEVGSGLIFETQQVWGFRALQKAESLSSCCQNEKGADNVSHDNREEDC